jgi:23S rRNA (cytosine1962-C5)-methyltransferase
MNRIHNLVARPNSIQEYKNGLAIISTNTVYDVEKLEEGSLVNIVDSKNRFLAIGYIGKQNKGRGWVLSQKEQKIDQKFFQVKFKKALEYRKDLFNDIETNAFRLFNAEGDGVGGITIDYFDGYCMITWYSEGIYKFKDIILKAFGSVYKYKALYQKKRFSQQGQYLDDESDFVDGVAPDFPIIIKENGVNFAVNLDDGPMTGIFLDQREVRKTIRDKYSKNRSVLNTFSYTGAFSVYAALGGAKVTTSVDLANRSLPKTSEQFALNNIDPKTQNIIVKDVFEYFKTAIKYKNRFDLVVVDPPSFARSKKITFSVSKDYVNLLKQIIQITNKGGVIVASTNYANLNLKRFRDFIDKAFKESRVKYIVEDVFTLPKDFKVDRNFPQGDYLKVVFIKKLS